ncbi:hypothetical protein BC829DRAFT_260866 [Chytridium lagenaria]|nr:hypothetical protein BC829DRAFT_260866 [Chytridium lagenaria]
MSLPEFEIKILVDALLSFEALIRGSINEYRISDILLNQAGLVESLLACYDIANAFGQESSDSALKDTTRLKLSTLALLDAVLDASFFLPFKLPLSELNGKVTELVNESTTYDWERAEKLFEILSTLLMRASSMVPLYFKRCTATFRSRD